MITGSGIAVGGIVIHQLIPDFPINGQMFWGIAMVAASLVVRRRLAPRAAGRGRSRPPAGAGEHAAPGEDLGADRVADRTIPAQIPGANPGADPGAGPAAPRDRARVHSRGPGDLHRELCLDLPVGRRLRRRHDLQPDARGERRRLASLLARLPLRPPPGLLSRRRLDGDRGIPGLRRMFSRLATQERDAGDDGSVRERDLGAGNEGWGQARGLQSGMSERGMRCQSCCR